MLTGSVRMRSYSAPAEVAWKGTRSIERGSIAQGRGATLKVPAHAVDSHTDPQRRALHPAVIRPPHRGARPGTAAVRNPLHRRRFERPKLRTAREPGGDGRAPEGHSAATKLRSDGGALGGIS